MSPQVRPVFTDYFRCPAELVGPETANGLSETAGFFRFDRTLGYGRIASVAPSREPAAAPDVPTVIRSGDSSLGLPFDLPEVVENLRYERYKASLPNHRGLANSAIARDAYYLLRPFLSVSARKRLQKIRLSGWEDIAFPEWPVDVSVDRLMRSAFRNLLTSSGAMAIPFIWFWPGGVSSCATMTHDVEGRVGRDSCDALMDLDDEFGVKSAFQIVPEERYDDVLHFVESVRSRGFEVNVHDINHDGRLFRGRQQFVSRAQRINEHVRQFRCRGFRSGAMYREQDWYDAFEFSYDMSVPNVAHLEAQRGGCCTVMPYFVGEVLELPLTTTQDYSLLHILGDYSTALWSEQMARIIAENGLISFIIHPDYMIEDRARAVYRDLLTNLSRERAAGNVWVAPPADIDTWWRDRHKMVLVPEGDSWRVEGPSSDRACVAYAILEDGHCVYTLDPPSNAHALAAAQKEQG